RRGTGATWRDAIGAFFIWQSTSLVVARASVLGLFARKAAFLRTPKTTEQAKLGQALRANWAESLLALLGLVGIVAALTRPTQLSGWLLAVLLVFPTLGMAAAPVNSWAARRAALPAALQARRTTEFRRDRRSFAAGAAAGGLVTVAAVVVAAVALLLAPSHHFAPPTIVGPSGGNHSRAPSHPATSHSPAPTSTPSPTTSTPSPSTSTPSPTPTPTSSPPASTSTPSARPPGTAPA